MSTPAAREFVQSLALPEPAPQLESVERAAPVIFSEEQEAVAVGAQVTEFSNQVASAQRAAVADCLLLAQLAANKATAQQPDLMAWYRKYVEVLQGVGWTVQSMSLEEKQVSDMDAGVHSAIIPVLTGMLGPAVAAASMVISVLKGLQEMDKGNPWITVFDRASQHASGAKFQFGFVDADAGANPAISIKLLAVAIDAKRTITQVLFFKFSQNDAKLKTSEGELSIMGSRLESIQAVVADRVQPFLAENISKLDI
ncbi:MAG: hypothetical protein ABI633_01365 [Burkholderiales bacterium]